MPTASAKDEATWLFRAAAFVRTVPILAGKRLSGGSQTRYGAAEQAMLEWPMPEARRGVLTMAFGKAKYLTMANRLAESIRLRNPETVLAIVTDAPDQCPLFDIRIAVRPEFGTNLDHKIHMDAYSPFDETLFIDSDCLLFKSLTPIWRFFDGAEFGVCGITGGEGRWFGADVAGVRRMLGIAGGIPRFNGGLVYFTRSEKAAAIFATARELLPRYRELGFGGAKGRDWTVADEPMFSLAMALHGVAVMEDDGATMRTPINRESAIVADIVDGRCSFVKEGRSVHPAILHFANNEGAFHYWREAKKLEWLRHGRIGRLGARALHIATEPSYRIGYALIGRPLALAKSVAARRRDLAAA